MPLRPLGARCPGAVCYAPRQVRLFHLFVHVRYVHAWQEQAVKLEQGELPKRNTTSSGTSTQNWTPQSIGRKKQLKRKIRNKHITPNDSMTGIHQMDFLLPKCCHSSFNILVITPAFSIHSQKSRNIFNILLNIPYFSFHYFSKLNFYKTLIFI